MLSLTMGAPCAINAGEWHHYVVSYDGTSLAKGYIDGVLATQASTSGGLSASDLTIAATGVSGGSPGNTFPADFCDVRVFASQLTLSQALQLFGAGFGRSIALGGEVVWIPCNSLNVMDQSGNGFNGVLYGQPQLVAS
jgi:Concanavalin A-like lectin/glucanases superfamily